MIYHHTSHDEPSFHLRVAGHSETGQLQTQNADAFALFDLSDAGQAVQLGKLYLLADGIGNQPGSAIASRLAIETIPDIYYHQATGDSLLGRLQQAFWTAHTTILHYAELHPEYAGMGTTCTALVIKGKRLWVAHVGDSRVYLVRQMFHNHPTIARLTTDHSFVAAQVRSGLLPSQEMRESPIQRDIFLRALGGDETNEAHPDFVVQDIRAGDTLILCSDGLWSTVSEEQIAQVVSTNDLRQACTRLVQQADQGNGDENVSVILLSFS